MDVTADWNAEEKIITVHLDLIALEGLLVVPPTASGLVIFVHAGNCCRHSTRNRYLAHRLRQSGLATLLIDLMTADEEAIDARTRHLRSDTLWLAQRLSDITVGLMQHPDTCRFTLGYFGAEAGGSAALVAAAEHATIVRAIVSRSAWLDVTGDVLALVKAPTLLIVGEQDLPVVCLNQDALIQLQAPKQLQIISGASHLFEESGALEVVARSTAQWFNRYLTPTAQSVEQPPEYQLPGQQSPSIQHRSSLL